MIIKFFNNNLVLEKLPVRITMKTIEKFFATEPPTSASTPLLYQFIKSMLYLNYSLSVYFIGLIFHCPRI